MSKSEEYENGKLFFIVLTVILLYAIFLSIGLIDTSSYENKSGNFEMVTHSLEDRDVFRQFKTMKPYLKSAQKISTDTEKMAEQLNKQFASGGLTDANESIAKQCNDTLKKIDEELNQAKGLEIEDTYGGIRKDLLDLYNQEAVIAQKILIVINTKNETGFYDEVFTAVTDIKALSERISENAKTMIATVKYYDKTYNPKPKQVEKKASISSPTDGSRQGGKEDIHRTPEQ